MRNQKIDILADVDEENFDRAFDIFQPGENQTRIPFTPLLIVAAIQSLPALPTSANVAPRT